MIYDYNEVNKILDNLNKNIIKEQEPIGYTNLEKIPIRHFTIGGGNKHIVVSAAWHSNEIISTTLLLNLMKHLTNATINKDITIHFIPILNPEGYIINTQAIRTKLNKSASEKDIINFAYEFYKKYKIDTLNKFSKTKLHQEIFNNTNYKCINKNYPMLKDAVREILQNHPKGSIIDWASNGNGIDLNSNSKNKIVTKLEYNNQTQYNNIRLDIPSPIGYPGNNKETNFKQEIEIQSLDNLLNNLNSNNNTLLAYINYHSIGGMIYQRPEDNNIWFNAYNYYISKYYNQYTNYKIITKSQNKITSVNDTLRIKYIGNLLIELSPMMGNPIGPYGDINNFKNTINNNITSFMYLLDNIIDIYNESKLFTQNNIELLYQEIDNEYNKKNTKNKVLIK